MELIDFDMMASMFHHIVRLVNHTGFTNLQKIPGILNIDFLFPFISCLAGLIA